jgi:hypothetical protein
VFGLRRAIDEGISFLGITLTADNILALATNVGMVAGAVWFVYGVIMKGVVGMGSVKR